MPQPLALTLQIEILHHMKYNPLLTMKEVVPHHCTLSDTNQTHPTGTCLASLKANMLIVLRSPTSTFSEVCEAFLLLLTSYLFVCRECAADF